MEFYLERKEHAICVWVELPIGVLRRFLQIMDRYILNDHYCLERASLWARTKERARCVVGFFVV